MTFKTTELQSNKIPTVLKQVEFTDLRDYLSLRRPAWTWGDTEFIRLGIEPLAKYCDDFHTDAYGNIIARIGESKLAWSSHTDTAGQAIPGWRRPMFDGDKFTAGDGGILGADDGTGVWLMASMIRAKKPGIYMFHRAEEIGGLGSHWASVNTIELFDDIDICIALDRKGTDNIITHQAGGRCCSDEFAQSLSEQLPGYVLDDTGVFTDSANYTHLIAECTNLSVGYAYEHSSREYQSISHANLLLDMLMDIDESKLSITRQPGDFDWSDDLDWSDEFDHMNSNIYYMGGFSPSGYDEYDDFCQTIIDEVETVAVILEESGYTAEYIRKLARSY